MKDEQIKEFLTKAAHDEDFKKEFLIFAESVNDEEFFEDERDKFLKKILIPWSKRLGYNFSYNELINFDRIQNTEKISSICADNIKKVSGGVMPDLFAKGLISLCLGL